MHGTRTLILGGARSGKTERALEICEQFNAQTYIATAEAGDLEMQERIRAHRAERGDTWRTIEEPLDLCGAIASATQSDNIGHVVLVDCLTLWISNLMHDGRDADVEFTNLVRVVGEHPGGLVIVSNEVGLGIVPDTNIGRIFRDLQGRVNQLIAKEVDRVEFVVAGLPITVKP